MERAHPIGPNNNVKVYRLITQNSYEKKMSIEASRKLGLSNAIMDIMDTNKRHCFIDIDGKYRDL